MKTLMWLEKCNVCKSLQRQEGSSKTTVVTNSYKKEEKLHKLRRKNILTKERVSYWMVVSFTFIKQSGGCGAL